MLISHGTGSGAISLMIPVGIALIRPPRKEMIALWHRSRGQSKNLSAGYG